MGIMIRNAAIKFCLMALGVIMALALLETGFRVTGGLLSAVQRTRNRQGVFKEGAYRILCLGESTTQGQWPPRLEEELNRRNSAVAFKVIDQGIGGTSTGVILSKLEGYLDAYDPHMVVVMMGINDGEWVWKNPVEYEDEPSVRRELFLKNLRLNKLARYIIDGIKNRVASRKQADLEHTNPQAFIALGNQNRERGDYEKALAMYESAMIADPKDSRAYIGLGKLYGENGEQEKAEKTFQAGIKTDPKNALTYFELGHLYYKQAEYAKAEKMYAAAIKAAPNDPLAYGALGNLYRKQNEFIKAEKAYEAGIKSSPENAWVYYELGNLYREKRKFDQAEKMYLAGIKTDPFAVWMYLELGNVYMQTGEPEKAERVLTEGRAAIGNDPRITGALSLFYLQQGKIDLWKNNSRATFPPLKSIRNYEKLRDIVLRRGVKLVCMQYPLRDASALKIILGNDRRIVYVENRKNFEEALKTQKLTDLFVDMFAGDFGHCTNEGNKVIAKNLADVICHVARVGEETKRNGE